MCSCAYTGLARSDSTASELANWTLILVYLLTWRDKPWMSGRLLIFYRYRAPGSLATHFRACV